MAAIIGLAVCHRAAAQDPQSTPPPAPPAASTQNAPAQSPGTPPPPPPTSRVPDSVTQRETITNDSDSDPRLNNEPVDPSLPGFFLIPGTQTRLRIGGRARVDLLHDFEPIGDHNEFEISSIPVDVVSGADNTQIQARDTRFDFELRRPSAVVNQDIRMLFEFDFFGAGGEKALNLRHAYGQIANVLGGFTTSTLQDVDARPDTLDHEGPPARVSQRNAQIRYTLPLPHRQSLAFAVEEPHADIPAVTANQVAVTPFNPWPDVVARYRLDAHRGHLQIGGILRSIGAFAGSGAEQQQVTGAGISASASLVVFHRDTLVIEINGGQGIARYIRDLSGQGLDAALDQNGRAKALTVGAGVLGYEHVWSPRLRTTGAFSLDRVENLPTQPDTTYHQGTYATTNLLFKPLPSFTTGVEYDYGRFEEKDGHHGFATRLQFVVQYDLVK